MNIDKQYKRAVLLFLFSCGKSDRSAAIQINNVHGEHTIGVGIAREWFKKFKIGESSIDDELSSERPVNFDDGILRNLVESELQLTVDQIAERMNSSHGTGFRHSKKIEKVSTLGKWVLHEISEANCQQKIYICTFLLSRFGSESFLDRLVTDDEKLIIYHNVTRKGTVESYRFQQQRCLYIPKRLF